eukprot:6188273-Pleurochrysis_carterae.AAC.1
MVRERGGTGEEVRGREEEREIQRQRRSEREDEGRAGGELRVCERGRGSTRQIEDQQKRQGA